MSPPPRRPRRVLLAYGIDDYRREELVDERATA